MMGYLFGGFYNKDDHILGGYIGVPIFGESTIWDPELWVEALVLFVTPFFTNLRLFPMP